MAVSEDESVWRKLGTALVRAGSAAAAGSAYPGLACAHSVFYAVEQAGDRWLILGSAASVTPQEARDELAHQFLLRTAQAAEGSREQDDYRAAAWLLDRERRDQMTAAGRRFRVARAEQVLRMGPDGPEPPRPGDGRLPDPRGPRSGRGFIGEADSDTGPESAALKALLRGSVTRSGGRPAEVIEDEVRGRAAYPRLVLLGAWFAIGEHADGAWTQPWLEEHASPALARASLVSYFREYAPAWEKPGPQICAAYASAADTLERGQADEITAGGRRFRITRIQRLARMNSGGEPELPRPSDFDPHLPPAA